MIEQTQTVKRKLVGSAKHLVRPSRAADAIALLERWLNEESDYDEQTWPELKSALDRDRLSDRKLFDE